MFAENDTFSFERDLALQGFVLVAGVDEAGRGPLAGPVVAASVILPPDCAYEQFKDSKKLTPKARKKLYAELWEINAMIGVGVVSAAGVDRINILQASLLAMKRATHLLPLRPDYLLVDGKFPVPITIPQQALIKGETRSASIAAASIIAKVTRDELMQKLHLKFPVYNFHKHKGYPTVMHRRAIRNHGPCEIHRKTFKGVREYISRES